MIRQIVTQRCCACVGYKVISGESRGPSAADAPAGTS
jgi:hypothetical protein